MSKSGALLIFITALFWTSFATPESVLKELKNDFFFAIGYGSQYGVLYLHRGGVDLPPVYDVHGVCAGGNLNKQIENWIKRVGPEGMVAALNPPLWPTYALAQLQCKDHPNIAVAGLDKTKPKNTGHSEYFLLKEPSGALDPMLTSYKKNEHDTCPNAVFLYSYLTPCHSCANLILCTIQRIINACLPKKSPVLYLGYTKIYDRKTWIDEGDKKMLEKFGVKIFEIINTI